MDTVLSKSLLAFIVSVSGAVVAHADAPEETPAPRSGLENRWADLSDCYSPDWGYDYPDRSRDHGHHGGYYLWYCQAKPFDSAGFHFRSFHYYASDRGTARDHALLRCERHAPRCVSRCALLPRACRPHFWD
jgi:hypothetical protein